MDTSVNDDLLPDLNHLYIGKEGCKKASCPHKQEFPDGPNPYCMIHAVENSNHYKSGEDQE